MAGAVAIGGITTITGTVGAGGWAGGLFKGIASCARDTPEKNNTAAIAVTVRKQWCAGESARAINRQFICTPNKIFHDAKISGAAILS
jgi:hypothetical protein